MLTNFINSLNQPVQGLVLGGAILIVGLALTALITEILKHI